MEPSTTSGLASVKRVLSLGVVFLLPVGMIVLLVGKVVHGMKALANLVAPVLPIETWWGVILLNVAAVALILGACCLAGLVAERKAALKLTRSIDSVLIATIPGYTFLRGLGDTMRQSEARVTRFAPIWVQFDDCTQLAFEAGRDPRGNVLAYLPGAPNPWSGTLVHVSADRVTLAEASIREAIASIRQLGDCAPILPATADPPQGSEKDPGRSTMAAG